MKKFVRVPIRGITAEELIVLWKKGKLYQEVNTIEIPDEELLARCQQEALRYVESINEFATPEWLLYIKNVWKIIIFDDEFTGGLMIRKGRMQGQLNRYFVTNIAFHMKALDIYQSNSLLELHKKLEGVKEKNGIYKAARMYCLNRAQRQRIREIKESFISQN